MPIYGKNLLKSSSSEKRMLWAESLHQSCKNDGRTLMFDLFTATSSLLLYAMGPILCMEKMLVISNDFSTEASGSVAPISCGAYLRQGNERLLKWLWSIDQDGCHAHI